MKKDIVSIDGLNISKIKAEDKFVKVTKTFIYENDQTVHTEYNIKEGVYFRSDELDVEKFDFEEGEKAFLRMYEHFEKHLEKELDELCKAYRNEMFTKLAQKYDAHGIRTRYTMITKKAFGDEPSAILNNKLFQIKLET